MKTPSSISPMPARRADRSSAWVEIFVRRLMTPAVLKASALQTSPIAATAALRYPWFDRKHFGKRHDRLRSRRASHDASAALVRGFRGRRALRAAKPDPNLGDLRRVPDRERRYPSGALRRRILPHPRDAASARARLS